MASIRKELAVEAPADHVWAAIRDVGAVHTRLARDVVVDTPASGPEALSMTEIAEQISRAIGKTVRYVNVSPADRNQAMLAFGVPSYIVDALDVQARERRKGATGEGVVHSETHVALGIRPTTFAEFARRNAAELRGEAVRS